MILGAFKQKTEAPIVANTTYRTSRTFVGKWHDGMRGEMVAKETVRVLRCPEFQVASLDFCECILIVPSKCIESLGLCHSWDWMGRERVIIQFFMGQVASRPLVYAGTFQWQVSPAARRFRSGRSWSTWRHGFCMVLYGFASFVAMLTMEPGTIRSFYKVVKFEDTV